MVFEDEPEIDQHGNSSFAEFELIDFLSDKRHHHRIDESFGADDGRHGFDAWSRSDSDPAAGVAPRQSLPVIDQWECDEDMSHFRYPIEVRHLAPWEFAIKVSQHTNFIARFTARRSDNFLYVHCRHIWTGKERGRWNH